MQFLYLDSYIGLRLILVRNLISQRYYINYDLTIKTFVDAHLPDTKKGELTNQNAAYKIIALEYRIKPCFFDNLK